MAGRSRWCSRPRGGWSRNRSPAATARTAPESNVTETVERLEAVSSSSSPPPAMLCRCMLVLPGSIAGSAAIEAGGGGGVIRYSVTHHTTQAIYEMPFSAGNWTFPGRLVTSFAGPTSRSRPGSPARCRPIQQPATAAGDLVIYDGSDGHRPASIKPPFGNHRMHVGVVRPGASAVGVLASSGRPVHGVQWLRPKTCKLKCSPEAFTRKCI